MMLKYRTNDIKISDHIFILISDLEYHILVDTEDKENFQNKPHIQLKMTTVCMSAFIKLDRIA